MSARLRPAPHRAVLLGAVCVAAVGLASPSFAASKASAPLTVKDATGDANGFNDQFGLLPAGPPEQSDDSTSQKSADIVSFTLSHKGKAFVGSLTLAAPPAQGTDYRIRMSAPGCSTYFLEYEHAPALAPAGEVRHNCDGGAQATFEAVDATVTGSTITWTIPVKGMPGGLKAGSVLAVAGAQTSVETAAIIPGIDQVRTDKTFVL